MMRLAAAASIVHALLLSPALARAQDVFELETIAPGVMVADVLPNPAAYAFANSLVVLGENGVLVVDTQQSLTAAESLIADIRRLTDVPVRWVVNTHWHADHVNGNQAYAEAFPGVEFITHATTAEDMATLGAQRRAQELAELPASIEARRGWLASGRGPGQEPLSDASRVAVQRSLDLRIAYLGELERITPTPPTRVVDDRLELRVGRHRVVVMHVGPAHTRGDLVVVLPDDGIVAVGDLLEEGIPWFEDASPAGWLRALRRIAELEPSVMVPSHGSVQRDRELLDLARNLLESVLLQAATSNDTTAAEAAQPLWPELEQSYAERYGVSSDAFREAAQLAVRRARLERRAASPSDAAGEAMMAADRAFAGATADRGIDGWLEYFADDGAVYQADEVARGHEAIRRLMGPLLADTTVQLVWEPDEAVAAPDGQLGYTTGPYRVLRVIDDSVLDHGRYLTVWRRTPAGWKVVADIGAAAP